MIEDGHIIVTLCGGEGLGSKHCQGRSLASMGKMVKILLKAIQMEMLKICANMLSFTMFDFKQTISIDTRMIGNLCCLTFD